MKLFLSSLAIVLNALSIQAQEKCLTKASVPPQWIFNKSSTKSLLASTSYTLNVFVHIVRSSEGEGLGTTVLTTIINSLNDEFQSTEIQFSLLGSDFIDNDHFYDNINGREDELFEVNQHCEAIDIYVLGETTIWNVS